MRWIRVAMLIAMAALTGMVAAVAPAAPADRYAEGQVWEYKTRPQDAGSLLKIGRIEDGGKLGRIYHISIIGIVLGGKPGASELQHAPVSQVTLDASVTRLSDAKRDWPDIEGGIAEWRKARGGVFDVSVSQIVDMLDKMMSTQPAAPPANENTAT